MLKVWSQRLLLITKYNQYLHSREQTSNAQLPKPSSYDRRHPCAALAGLLCAESYFRLPFLRVQRFYLKLPALHLRMIQDRCGHIHRLHHKRPNPLSCSSRLAAPS